MPTADLITLIHDSRSGRREALDELMPLVYEQLRAIAGRQMSWEKPGHTMDRVGPLLMWSADYPHAEGEPHVDVYRRKAGVIGDAAADAFWGGNAEFLLGR